MRDVDIAAINHQMVDKLLGEPAQAYVEGGYALRVVHTTGRRSGHRRSTPLGVIQLAGVLYLVTPDRGRDWVRNLDADPAVVLDPGAQRRVATPVSGASAARVVAAYLKAMTVPWAVRAFSVGPDANSDEIIANLDTIGVFRLDQP